MDDPTRPPPTDPTDPADRIVALLERGALDEATVHLERVQTTAVAERTSVVRALRSVAEDRPAVVGRACPALVPFLEDEVRAIRLTTAKLFVAVAAATPGSVVPVVPSLADRLADEDEFYYVRARAAEALGYVALEHPDAVASPETLADLRIGLSFDEPEVREKLAKALEHVALGDPRRLRHLVSRLVEHLDDENELVRYHLTTALVVIGCASPRRLAPARDALLERLDDENEHVRGRAAEALGLLARADTSMATPLADGLTSLVDSAEPFLAERVRFAREAVIRGAGPGDVSEVGTVDGVRATTSSAVEAMTSPDGDGACPHCGLALPEGAAPMCPRCGAPF